MKNETTLYLGNIYISPGPPPPPLIKWLRNLVQCKCVHIMYNPLKPKYEHTHTRSHTCIAHSHVAATTLRQFAHNFVGDGWMCTGLVTLWLTYWWSTYSPHRCVFKTKIEKRMYSVLVNINTNGLWKKKKKKKKSQPASQHRKTRQREKSVLQR